LYEECEYDSTNRGPGVADPRGAGVTELQEVPMTAVSVRPAVSYRPAVSGVVVMRPVGGAVAGTGTRLAVAVPVQTRRRTVGAAAESARRPAGHTPVRLTRRGRAVVVGLLLNLAVAAVVTLLALAGAGTPADRHAATSSVVVQSGDTLWSIATQLDPQGDPRATIAELRRLNGLSGSTIEAGQELALPVR
jgi:nucleoid-associated protein YgaU